MKHAAILLAALAGPAWDGYEIHNGRLFVPGYRGAGYTPDDLLAQFWQLQELYTLRRENARLKAEALAAQEAQDRAESRAEWYRRQLTLESRAGAMLARLLA